MKTLVLIYLTVQMHFICISKTFKNVLKSTDLIVLLKAVKGTKIDNVFRQKVPYIYKESSDNICTTSLLIQFMHMTSGMI